MEGDAWTAPGGDYNKVNIMSMSLIPFCYDATILTYTATNSSEFKVCVTTTSSFLQCVKIFKAYFCLQVNDVHFGLVHYRKLQVYSNECS